MFAIVGSINYKKYLEDDQLPPFYSDPMYPELYIDRYDAEQRLFQRVIEFQDKYNEKLHRVENYKGAYHDTVLLDEHEKIKCFYGYDQDYEMPFGYVETKELYVTYRLLEI